MSDFTATITGISSLSFVRALPKAPEQQKPATAPPAPDEKGDTTPTGLVG